MTRRLLVISPDYPPQPGGIAALTAGLARHLDSYEVHVVSLEWPRTAEAHDFVPVRRARNAPAHGRRALMHLAALALREGLRFRPHAILSMHVRSNAAAAAMQRLLGVPVVLYLHAKELADHPRQSRMALRAADAVIAVSTYTAGLARELSPETEVRVIPPGVDLPGDAPSRTFEGPTLVTVSRLDNDYKGHDVVLRALARVLVVIPDARWLVIGSGPKREPLERLAEKLGVAKAVTFLGGVDDTTRDAVLAEGQVFVMPSRVPPNRCGGEGFGIVYLEASAHGLAVIAGDRGGSVDAVRHGRTGILVDAEDPAAVADAIVALLGDPARCRRLGEQGKLWAAAHSWPIVARQVSDVIDGTLPPMPARTRISRAATADPAEVGEMGAIAAY
jgi:phosphatidylinositol alpha-1,6-mannosyltransferase